jgi:hypothetical protein
MARATRLFSRAGLHKHARSPAFYSRENLTGARGPCQSEHKCDLRALMHARTDRVSQWQSMLQPSWLRDVVTTKVLTNHG